MQAIYTPDPLLTPLRRKLTRPQWRNLLLVVVALQWCGSLVGRRLALFVLRPISAQSCYRHLERFLTWASPERLAPLCRPWVRAVLRLFAPGRQPVPLLIDWTWHRDRCKSLWVMLPVGGRAVPLAFWLAPPDTGGPGSQRRLEDQAFTQLREWLPRGRRFLLIGDRGFRGRERMEFLRHLGFSFVLRISGETRVQREGRWQKLSALRPELGQRWEQADVLLGKDHPGPVNLVVLRQPLRAPKALKTNRGKPTGQQAEETTWYLASDLSLDYDLAQVYAWRMQIEQSFRDFKSLFGLEHEACRQPWQRLGGLLWALMIGVAQDLQVSQPRPQAPQLPRRRPGSSTEPPTLPHYRAESATREGLHRHFCELLWQTSPLLKELQDLPEHCLHLCARPQVQGRRRSEPALRNRGRTLTRHPAS